MKYRVQLRQQVRDFLESLAPEPRRKIKLALRSLEAEEGDRLALRERLSGYHRLKVGGYRIIYRYLPGRIIEAIFAEERSLMYLLFEREFLERLRREPGDEEKWTVEEKPARYGRKDVTRRRGSGRGRSVTHALGARGL